MNIRKSVEQRRKEIFIFAACASPVVLWLGLACGPLLRRGLVYFFTHANQIRPFPINISLWNWKYAFFFLLAYVLAVAVYGYSLKDIDTETPDGSLKFGDPKAEYRKYAERMSDWARFDRKSFPDRHADKDIFF